MEVNEQFSDRRSYNIPQEGFRSLALAFTNLETCKYRNVKVTLFVENLTNRAGLQKAFDVTMSYNFRRPLYINIEGLDVYKVNSISGRRLPLCIVNSL